MDILLDTHTLLWFITDAPRLSRNAVELVNDSSNNKFVSIVSLWEIAIKLSIGKIFFTEPFHQLFPHQLDINGFELLPVEINHTSVIAMLPFHHRDPFDRLLIAQSLEENMSIVSADKVFDDYGVTRLW